MAAIIESDDDSFLLPPLSPPSPPSRPLKRLKKKTLPLLPPTPVLSPRPPPSSSLPSSPALLSASDDSNDSFPLPDLPAQIRAASHLLLQPDACGDLDPLSSDTDQDDSSSDDSSDGGDSNEFDECVDEDDELAVLNFLDKGRKSGSNEQNRTIEQPLPAEAPEHEAVKIGKEKRKASELDEIHAASQRLLRETPNVSFKPQISCAKPISSVLEKIRLRKLQLAEGFESRISTSLQMNQVTTITSGTSSTVQVSQVTTATLEVGILNEDSNSPPGRVPFADASMDHEGISSFSQTNKGKEGAASLADGQSDDLSGAAVVENGNSVLISVKDTQELSSESPSNLGVVNECHFQNLPDGVQNDSMNLQLDAEDCGNWDDEEGDKENVAPSPVPARINRGAPVRALVDDEAEDEDEDVLALDDDEAADEEEGVGDMIVEDVVHEGNVDVQKRAELHRKWLEQQDAANTDDILLRLQTGWRSRENRKRGLEFLDVEEEERDIPLKQTKNGPEEMENDQSEDEWLDENSQSSAASKEKDGSAVDVNLFESFGDVDDGHESSDEEEREERIMRQRFLQDSENQGEFLLPADDETSREVFVLINRANDSTRNKKLKAGAVDLKLIGGGTSCSNTGFNSKASFLRKKAASASTSAQRQGSSSTASRSFIFGRDDSNSSHGSTDHRQRQTMGNKENLEPGSVSSSSSSSSSGPMKVEAKQTTSRLGGPSLFEILRGQSKSYDPQSPMHHKASPISPMFSAFKLIKANGNKVPHPF